MNAEKNVNGGKKNFERKLTDEKIIPEKKATEEEKQTNYKKPSEGKEWSKEEKVNVKGRIKEKQPFWNRVTFMVITGASQGIGKHLAIEFSRYLKPKSMILLLARSQQNLQDTKAAIMQINPEIQVQIYPVDLCIIDRFEYQNILSVYKSKIYELALLIHNAGNIICDIPASNISDAQIWNKYMSLNLYSVTALTAAFLDLIRDVEICLLNITSLAAVEPLKGLGYYCVGKASREMYFRVLAKENQKLSILSYSPGPVETAMFKDIVQNCCDPDLKAQFETLQASKGTVKIEDTIKKLVDILGSRDYKSGQRIDYYDEIQ